MLRQVGLAWEYVPGEKLGNSDPSDLLMKAWKWQVKSSGVRVDLAAIDAALWDLSPPGESEVPGGGLQGPPGGPPAGRAVPACHSTIVGGSAFHQQGKRALASGGKVTIARGGRFLKLKVDNPLRRERRCRRGGTVGRKALYSHRSRRSMLNVVNQMRQDPGSAGRWRFVTLTYQNVQEADEVDGQLWRITKDGKERITPRGCKKHMRAFLKRLYAQVGLCGVIWKIEPQKRGMPHFHLLVLLADSCLLKFRTETPGDWSLMPRSQIDEEREWFARAWVDVINGTEEAYVVHRYDAKEDKAGWQKLNDWDGVIIYCGKYVGKIVGVQAAAEWQDAGRWWGIENLRLLPIDLATKLLSPGETVKVQRVMRRWAKSKTRGVFSLVDHMGRPQYKDDAPAMLIGADWKTRKALRTPKNGHLAQRLRVRRPFIGKHFGGVAYMAASEAWRLLEYVLGDLVEFDGEPLAAKDAVPF